MFCSTIKPKTVHKNGFYETLLEQLLIKKSYATPRSHTHTLITYWNTQKGNDIRSSTVAGSRQLYSSLEDKQLPSL